jgi:hypothetical protein
MAKGNGKDKGVTVSFRGPNMGNITWELPADIVTAIRLAGEATGDPEKAEDTEEVTGVYLRSMLVRMVHVLLSAFRKDVLEDLNATLDAFMVKHDLPRPPG